MMFVVYYLRKYDYKLAEMFYPYRVYLGKSVTFAIYIGTYLRWMYRCLYAYD